MAKVAAHNKQAQCGVLIIAAGRPKSVVSIQHPTSNFQQIQSDAGESHLRLLPLFSRLHLPDWRAGCLFSESWPEASGQLYRVLVVRQSSSPLAAIGRRTSADCRSPIANRQSQPGKERLLMVNGDYYNNNERLEIGFLSLSLSQSLTILPVADLSCNCILVGARLVSS